MENKILHSAIKSREAYNQLEALRIAKDLSDRGEILYKEIQEYYRLDTSAKCVDKEILLQRLKRKHPSEKHQSLFEAMLEQDNSVSPENIVYEVSELLKSNIKLDILNAANRGASDDDLLRLLEDYRDIVNSTQKADSSATSLYQDVSVEDILQKASTAAKINLSPKALNEATDGGVLRGHHLLFFARPDAGKTTLAIELLYGFLKQNLKVLYVGNEDPAHDVLLRIMTRLVRMSKKDIEANPQVAEARKQKTNFHNLSLVTMYPGTCSELSAAVEDSKPDVMIIDQARNIIHRNQSRVEQLEYVERYIRNLGKKHDIVTISFTQAGDSAEGKLILGMGDVDFSNTGMQASADLMVGMGVNADYEKQGRRMLSFPKNKLSGDKQPRMVEFDAKYNRIH